MRVQRAGSTRELVQEDPVAALRLAREEVAAIRERAGRLAGLLDLALRAAEREPEEHYDHPVSQAHVLALQLALSGHGRNEVHERLSGSVERRELDQILDQVFA